MNVVGACFGADDQQATPRVAFVLGGEEGGGQLPLAGAAQRIGLRIIGNQRLGARQPFGDRARDAGKIVDLVGIEPDAQPGRLQRVGELARTIAVSPGVAEEDIVLRRLGGGHKRVQGYTKNS